MKAKDLLVLLALLLIIVFIVLIKFENPPEFFEEEDNVKNYVLEDLRSKFPTADEINIIWVKKANSQNSTYYYIKASVSQNLHTLCPNLTIFYYVYPKQQFEPKPPEVIVKNCEFCQSPPCIIMFKEQAIIASYKGGGKAKFVRDFIKQNNAIPTDVVELNRSYWEVVWSGKNNKRLVATVSPHGNVLFVRVV